MRLTPVPVRRLDFETVGVQTGGEETLAADTLHG